MLWVYFCVVEFKAWHHTHRELALFAAERCRFPPSVLTLAANRAVLLDLFSSCSLPELAWKMPLM